METVRHTRKIKQKRRSERPLKKLFTALPLAALFLSLLVFAIAGPAALPCHAARETNEIRVGSEMEFRPYAFVDKDGQPAGFSIDLMKAVAAAMGLSIRMSTGPWDTVWNDLVAGKLDVVPSVAKLPDRTRVVDFSLPHTETFDAFFVRKGDPPINNIEGAKGKEIVVVRSDAAHHELLARKFQGRLVLVSTTPEGLSLVASGRHDAVLCPKLIGTIAVKEHGIKGLVSGPPIPDYKRVFSFAVRKGDEDLLEKLNQGLMIVKTSGQYDRIYDKWLTADQPWRRMQKYVVPAILTLAAIALIALICVVMLQMLVRKRTRELAQSNDMLRAAGEGLEEKVSQRTAELTEANLALESEVAERKAAGEALRRSEQRWATTLASIGDAVIATDNTGRVAFLNAVAEDLTGWTLDDAAGRPVTEVFHIINEQTRKAVEDPVARVLREGAIVGLANHTVLVRKDGTEAPIDDSGAPIRDVDGNIMGAVLVFRDITGRKRDEATLRESKARLDLALRSADMGAWHWDIPADKRYFDDQVCRLLGIDSQTFTGSAKEFFDVIHPDDRENLHAALARTVSEDVPYEPEYRAILPDGTIRHIAARGRLVRDDAGRPIRINGIIWDITDRKRREARITRLTHLYATLSRVNEALVRIRDGGALYEEVCRIIAKEGAFPLVWIGEVKDRQVVPAAYCGPAADYLKGLRIDVDGVLGQGPSGTCIREDRPVVNDDFDTNPATMPWREAALQHGFRASACFPLHRQGKPTGVLTIYGAQPHDFDAEQVELLQALAADISYALDTLEHEKVRSRTETDLQKSLRRFELLAYTASELLRAPDPQKLIDSLCRQVMEHLGCHAFFNFLAVEEVGRLMLNAYAGIPEEEARKIEWLDYGVAVCGCAARDASRIVAEHIPTTPDQRTELVKSYGIQAYACHPLLGPEGSVVGTLSFGTRDRETFSDEDLSLMKAVADQVAVAMIRVRDVEAVERARDEFEERVKERTAKLQESEEALRRASAYNRSLIEASLDPLVTIDPGGRISDVNAATEHATGYARSELIGTDFSDYFTDPENARAGYRRVFDEGQVRDYPLEIRHRDGHITKVLYNASVYRDVTGSVIGVFAAARDVSEQQKLEAQLRQAQKLEALGTLSGGIAHDFNNMLASIIGFTELIKDHTPEGSREHRHARRVLEAGIRGRELVRQMLTFSRQTEQEKKPLRLSSIVKESARLLRASIPSTVSIKVIIKSESGVILGDPTQIAQVLMNLATNAAYAMRETGGTLDIGLSDFSVSPTNGDPHGIEPGLYMRLTVRDTGTGIPPEIADRIFDPFFTTKKVGEGTGLGLSVVLGIVKQAHGYITVESKPGEGSTFNVYFPKIVEEPAAEGAAGDEAAPVGKESILFVDDEEALVEMGEELLAELGYEVTCRTGSREALALFRLDPSRFDLVITDQTMPDMTGVQLASELLSIRPDIPVILCTGFSHTASEESARAAGIKGFVMKPLTKRELAKTVRKILDAHAQG